MAISTLSILLQEAYRDAHTTACETKLRLTLFPGQLLRVPRSAIQMSVVGGRAWVSFGTSDVIVTAGESFKFRRRFKKDRIIQAVGKTALVLELY